MFFSEIFVSDKFLINQIDSATHQTFEFHIKTHKVFTGDKRVGIMIEYG